MTKKSTSMLKSGRPSANSQGSTLSALTATRSLTRVNFALDKGIYKELRLYSVNSGKPISEILRNAIQNILSANKSKDSNS